MKNPGAAARFYRLATWLDPGWSVPWYNLGLRAKYQGHWRDSMRFNQRAIELSSSDEAAWWNVGIAATAVHDWSEARRAWTGFGIKLSDGSGEVSMPRTMACVRLNPEHSAEVVWGERIDPARMLLFNVPLPDSGRRFRDIILNDGASNGTRTWEGREYPVFDELEVWQASAYSTFRSELFVPDLGAENKLEDICRDYQVGLEDWTTVRTLCAECSRGNPGPHNCKTRQTGENGRSFGFGAQHKRDVEVVLKKWCVLVSDAEYGEIELVFAAD